VAETAADHPPGNGAAIPPPEAATLPTRAPFLRSISATRFMVLLAVAPVLLIAFVVFVVGAVLSVATLWRATGLVLRGELDGHAAVLGVINLVIVMLEAVVFYIVGIGLYNLFICPLELARRLGLDTLDHLESRMVSVIVVMIAVTFLDRFVLTHDPQEILIYAVAIAMVIPPLVWFKQQLH
jgi:uncharacterized membrane protein YqhA